MAISKETLEAAREAFLECLSQPKEPIKPACTAMVQYAGTDEFIWANGVMRKINRETKE